MEMTIHPKIQRILSKEVAKNLALICLNWLKLNYKPCSINQQLEKAVNWCSFSNKLKIY